MKTPMFTLLAALAAVHLAAASDDKANPATNPAADPAWQALFDGKSPDGWKVADFREKAKITAANGELPISPGEPAAPPAGDDTWRQFRFREVDKLFANPGQGWMEDSRFPSSVVYLRYNWAEVEPVEGQYNWRLIDDAIAAAKSRSAAIAMRVMTANAHSTGYYCSPKWLGNYDYMKSKGWPFDAAVNFMLNNHVSMINSNIGRVPPEAMPQLEKLARLAGYRFVLREITHHKSVVHPGTLNLKMKWANVGVAKLYRPFHLQISLRNPAGDTVTTTTVAAADPRDWLPGERDLSVAVPIPSGLPPGEYTLAVAITDPANQRRPLNLAMDAPEKDGWYQVSRVMVE